jgi:hypothetical protein
MIHVKRLPRAGSNCALPHLEEHLLLDVLRRRAVAQRVQQEAERRSPVARVDVLERTLLARREPSPEALLFLILHMPSVSRRASFPTGAARGS